MLSVALYGICKFTIITLIKVAIFITIAFISYYLNYRTALIKNKQYLEIHLRKSLILPETFSPQITHCTILRTLQQIPVCKHPDMDASTN